MHAIHLSSARFFKCFFFILPDRMLMSFDGPYVFFKMPDRMFFHLQMPKRMVPKMKMPKRMVAKIKMPKRIGHNIQFFAFPPHASVITLSSYDLSRAISTFQRAISILNRGHLYFQKDHRQYISKGPSIFQKGHFFFRRAIPFYCFAQTHGCEYN